MHTKVSKWFETLSTNDASICVGPVCWVCGTALESWPLLPQSKAISKYHNARERTFRGEVDAVIQLIKRVYDKLQQDVPCSGVYETNTVSLKVLLRAAFVPTKFFNIVMQKTLEKIPTLIKSLEVRTPDYGKQSGALLRLSDLPPGVPHYEVELGCDNSIVLEQWFLTADQVLRDGQSLDEFQVRVDNALKARPPQLQVTSVMKALSFKKLRSSLAEMVVDATQAYGEKEMHHQRQAEPVPTPAVHSTGSRFRKEEPPTPTTVSRKRPQDRGPGSASKKRLGAESSKDNAGGTKTTTTVIGAEEDIPDEKFDSVQVLRMLYGDAMGRQKKGATQGGVCIFRQSPLTAHSHSSQSTVLGWLYFYHNIASQQSRQIQNGLCPSLNVKQQPSQQYIPLTQTNSKWFMSIS